MVKHPATSPALHSKLGGKLRGVVAKTSRHPPAKEIIGSTILPTATKSLFAGVAQWEERGPRKSVIGVRIAAPAPLVYLNGKSRRMVSARPQFEAACQLQKFCRSSTVGVQRACTSPTSVRFTRPAPDFDGGI